MDKMDGNPVQGQHGPTKKTLLPESLMGPSVVLNPGPWFDEQ